MPTIFGTNESDWLVGDQYDNIIRASGGNDYIEGGWGNDTLYGGWGDDWFIPGFGVDYIYGGSEAFDTGNDTVSYASYQDWGVRVNLLAGYGGWIPNGEADYDYLDGIENVVGSNWGDDLTGDLLDNSLRGEGGSDWLKGSGGDDELSGGGGNDTLEGGIGADFIDGGSGVDDVDYFWGHAGITVNLIWNLGVDPNGDVDSLVNVENIRGTNYDDFIAGNNSNNTIHGLYGVDTIYGYGGNDTITGGSLNDVIFGGDGHDTISGSVDDDTINGGAGDDIILGGRDDDMLAGGTGQDDFEFTSVTDTGAALATMDFVTDFSHAQGDLLRIYGFDANTAVGGSQAFSFIGEGNFTGAGGQVRYVQLNDSTRILADIDGDNAVDFAIYLSGYHDLVAADFYFG